MPKITYDEVGYWSEVKLDIIKEYAQAYTTILSKQKYIKQYSYIDAFAGSGVHLAKSTGSFIPGSPLNALLVKPPFQKYHLIDIDKDKAANLRILAKDYSNVEIYDGDCNQVLREQIYPLVKYNEYKRALCILDPYGLHLDWDIIMTAGQMKSIVIFLNFPVMDINMNALKHDKEKVSAEQISRMNAFWGDESWRQIGYAKSNQTVMFDEEPEYKISNDILEKSFRKRLKEVAGFKYVPEPIPMRNSNNAIVYYLYFASQKPVASEIAAHIFTKYKNKGL